jgi:SAM-dependent methyltransferase
VLEHVNDRPRLLREIRRVLKKDGHLIMTVPSLTWLWSQSDLDVGHFLRYSKRSVRTELKNSGFLVRSSRYFFVSIVLPLFVLRSIPFRLGFRQPVEDGVLLNQGGGIMGKILQKFETAFSGFTPLGTSLLVIATPSDISS